MNMPSRVCVFSFPFFLTFKANAGQRWTFLVLDAYALSASAISLRISRWKLRDKHLGSTFTMRDFFEFVLASFKCTIFALNLIKPLHVTHHGMSIVRIILCRCRTAITMKKI